MLRLAANAGDPELLQSVVDALVSDDEAFHSSLLEMLGAAQRASEHGRQVDARLAPLASLDVSESEGHSDANPEAD